MNYIFLAEGISGKKRRDMVITDCIPQNHFATSVDKTISNLFTYSSKAFVDL